MQIGYTCIKGHTFDVPKIDPAKEVQIPSLGRFAFRSSSEKDIILRFIDSDTPCFVNIFAPKEFGADATVALALALARDLATAVTPVAVSRATIEGLVLDIDDSAGAQAEGDTAWNNEEASTKSIFRLAPGFPQKADLLPIQTSGQQRRVLVLGYFSRRSFSEVVLSEFKKAYPRLRVERFPAEGHSISYQGEAVVPQLSRASSIHVADYDIVTTFGHQDTSVFDQSVLLIFLRGAKAQLLDWKKLDVLKETPDAKKMLDPKRPKEEHSPDCSFSVEHDDQSVTASVTCPRNPDPEHGNITCKEKPSWTLRWKIGVKGDKLSIQRKRIIFRGKDCFDEGE